MTAGSIIAAIITAHPTRNGPTGIAAIMGSADMADVIHQESAASATKVTVTNSRPMRSEVNLKLLMSRPGCWSGSQGPFRNVRRTPGRFHGPFGPSNDRRSRADRDGPADGMRQ